jgi:8-oxo-dGTP diphosphatase
MQATIQVTCAIIVKNNRVLCAQRSENMSHPLLWEFPGGKIEAGETASDCIIREIKEELNINIEILEVLESHIYTYAQKRRIELIPFICSCIGGNLVLKEHKAIRWVLFSELNHLNWVAADVSIAAILMKKYYQA